jgi:hypothetical protein
MTTRTLYTSKMLLEVKLGFGSPADGSITWQPGLTTSGRSACGQCPEDKIFASMSGKIGKLQDQFSPENINQETLDKHTKYLQDQVELIFLGVEPILWVITEPQQPWVKHTSRSLDVKDEDYRNVYVIVSSVIKY